MPQINVAPNKQQLEAYVRQGLTQMQIVDAWEKDSGVRVSRSAIGMAMLRHGVAPQSQHVRNSDLLPWKVKSEHKYHYDARMLRLEGRRRRGDERLKDRDLQKLGSWLNSLKTACDGKGAVVMYVPHTIEGFWWVPREAGDKDIIRRPEESGASGRRKAAAPTE